MTVGKEGYDIACVGNQFKLSFFTFVFTGRLLSLAATGGGVLSVVRARVEFRRHWTPRAHAEPRGREPHGVETTGHHIIHAGGADELVG